MLRERHDIRFTVVTDCSPANLMEHMADADAITVRDAPLPIEVLAAAPNLRVVSRHGVGYDNIPVDYCTSRDIPVTVVGDVNAVSVAEQTMLLILAAARQAIVLDHAMRSGDFAMRSRVVGVQLSGKTLFLIGFGSIGREVAKRAAAFGMTVLAFDPYAERAAAPARFVEALDEGLSLADVVSLHIPLRPMTRNIIGARELALLPEGAIVINTARGGLIDEAALVAALDSGHLRAAGLDTFAVEPLPADHDLLRNRKVVVSPHSAALTEESLLAMGLATVRNALDGIDDCLNPARVVNRVALEEKKHATQ